MRILILGNNFSAREFFKLFKKDDENIVFATISDVDNYIEFENIQDIIEFCEANDINLVLITEDNYIHQGAQEAISAMNISVFAPSVEAVAICSSKSYAKKFMHKNKISTPKFFVAEKPQNAIDYFKTTSLPQAIKPDSTSYQECTKFCETRKQAIEVINQFFASGNKRVILEDYIEGINFNVWIISNGYSAKIIGTSANYLNNIAEFEPDFITEELKEKIYAQTIIPTINALSEQGEEYIGILGFDFILSRNNKIYLLGYNNFFDDINVDFYIKGFDINWADVFDSTIVGDVFQKYEFVSSENNMMTIRQDEKIHFINANTKNNLKKYLEEMDFDLSEFYEAQKIWKF